MLNISITDSQKKLLDKIDLELLEVALDTTIAQGVNLLVIYTKYI
jgi:hypothetical protein